MAMISAASNVVCVLELRGKLLAPLMARNVLKSNVTWTSYPFVTPTGASGFFADVVNGMKFHEMNDNYVRHLHSLPDYRGVFALGAYPPPYGRMSKRHFRAHLGSLSFNYEAYIWVAGRNEGKKLAVIEEFLTEDLRFVVVAREPERLRRLQESVRGRIAPIAKKGSVQLEFVAEPSIRSLEPKSSDGSELTLALVPFTEIGSLPTNLLPYLTPLLSRGTERGIEWKTQYCAWDRKLRFAQGAQIYSDGSVGLSQSLLDAVGFFE